MVYCPSIKYSLTPIRSVYHIWYTDQSVYHIWYTECKKGAYGLGLHVRFMQGHLRHIQVISCAKLALNYVNPLGSRLDMTINIERYL